MYNRTQLYFDELKRFREEMRRIQADEKTELDRLERFKGSVGYRQDVAKVKANRKARVEALQASSREKFSLIIKGMRDAVRNRKIAAPTGEQEAILRLLSMRENLTVDEVLQAENSLKDCPIALSVLGELCHKHKLPWSVSNTLSSEGIFRAVDDLEDFANKTCSLRMVDHGSLWARSPKNHPGEDVQMGDIVNVRYDTDIGSVDEALKYCGFIKDVDAFKEVVDE